MDIGDKIKRGRKELDLSQDKLAQQLREMGLEADQVTISRIEANARRIFAAEIEYFSQALKLTAEYLLNSKKDWPPDPGDRLPDKPAGSIPLTPLKEATDTIPIISYVSAGETPVSYGDGGYPVGHGIDKMQRPEGVTDERAYGLVVKGDSMMPALPEGTVVVAITNEKARVGDIVICREKQTDKVYIKLLKHSGQTIVLESFNMQEHDPLIFQQGDFHFMHPVVSWNKAKKV